MAGPDVFGLYLENAGAGPAVIKTFTPLEEINKAISADVFKGFPHIRLLYPTYFFQKETKIEVLTAKKEDIKDFPAFVELITGRRKLVVKVEYCSIYGDC